MNTKAFVIVVALLGFAAGGVLSAVVFAPTQAKLDMVVYSAVRLGWVCHDKNVEFDECALMASGYTGDRR